MVLHTSTTMVESSPTSMSPTDSRVSHMYTSLTAGNEPRTISNPIHQGLPIEPSIIVKSISSGINSNGTTTSTPTSNPIPTDSGSNSPTNGGTLSNGSLTTTIMPITIPSKSISPPQLSQSISLPLFASLSPSSSGDSSPPTLSDYETDASDSSSNGMQPDGLNEPLRTIFVSGFPADVKYREIHNLFRFHDGFQHAVLNLKGRQPVAFATFKEQNQALSCKNLLQGIRFDLDSHIELRIELARTNSHATSSNKIKKRADSSTSTNSNSPTPTNLNGVLSPSASILTPTPIGLAQTANWSLASLEKPSTVTTGTSGNAALVRVPSAGDLNVLRTRSPLNNLVGTQTPTTTSTPSTTSLLSSSMNNTLGTRSISHNSLLNNGWSTTLPSTNLNMNVNGLNTSFTNLSLTSSQHTNLNPLSNLNSFNGNTNSTTHMNTFNNTTLPGNTFTAPLNGLSTHTTSSTQNAPQQPITTLFVANLGPYNNEDELRDLFSQCPGFRRVRIDRSKSGVAVAFVDFTDITCSTNALNQLRGHQGLRMEFARQPMSKRSDSHHFHHHHHHHNQHMNNFLHHSHSHHSHSHSHSNQSHTHSSTHSLNTSLAQLQQHHSNNFHLNNSYSLNSNNSLLLNHPSSNGFLNTTTTGLSPTGTGASLHSAFGNTNYSTFSSFPDTYNVL